MGNNKNYKFRLNPKPTVLDQVWVQTHSYKFRLNPVLQKFKCLIIVLLTVPLSTKRVLLICVVAGGGAAPQLPISSAFRDARVVCFSIKHEREHTRLAVGVSAVHMSLPGCVRTQKLGEFKM